MGTSSLLKMFLNKREKREQRITSVVPTAQGVVPQNDLSSTIIVSRCYNDLNFLCD